MAKEELLAHVRQDENDKRQDHTLKKHLEDTAKLAEQFAAVFGLQKLAGIVSRVHDYGKASQKFQDKIDPELHVNLQVDHSTAGAQFLMERYDKLAAILLAYVVAGHHGGLPNGKDDTESSLAKRLKRQVEEYRSRVPAMSLPDKILPTDFIPLKTKGKPSAHFLIRMLYSVLTDADFLDTEAFMTHEDHAARQHAITLPDLLPKLERKLATFQADTPINQKRADILRWCRAAAQQTPGLFSLTVPTGGGKTVSSIAFALDHALKYKLRRIIYVIPYTNIITQNAQVFRDIFGEDAVLEHHSNLDPKRVTAQNRLASQNWDAPIVVTTNVQFFESFYGNRSTACRKLHNVADSVIIFDEAQLFPPELLKPTLAVIRELVRNYGCTVVLCTATQPTLNNPTLLKQEALQVEHDIIQNPQQLYEEFQAIRHMTVSVINEAQSHDTLGEQLAKHKQILAIVNTRKDARLIFEQLIKKHPAHECFHLSTMMCSAHRSVTLRAIHACLEKDLPCRVVSTQLIEAGVDVDFPVVWRAIAGLDSVAQAAGRCNREGELDKGQVVVFHTEDKPPAGHLRYAAESGERMLNTHHADPLSLEAVKGYFEDFFWKQNNAHKMDKKGIMAMCNSRPDEIPFREIAQAFKIIDEPTRSILIPYQQEGKQALEELRKCRFHAKYPGYVKRELRKTLQRYTVQLRERVFLELYGYGVLDDVFEDGQFFVLTNKDIYTENVGLNPENPVFLSLESSII